jgi:hypothetical protein
MKRNQKGKNIMVIRKAALAIAMAISMGGIGITLNAQPVSRAAIGQRLEGPWLVSFSVDIAPGVTAPPQFSLSTFSPGGQTMAVGPGQAPPIPPVLALGKENSASVGEWLRVGDRQFVLTIVSLLSTNGVVGGRQTTRVTLTVNEAGDAFDGKARAEFADLDGKVVAGGTAAVKGTRIAVEVITPAE